LKRPPRIAYILEATGGGTRKHLRHLVSAVKPAGFDVLLIVSQGRDPDFADDILQYKAVGCAVEVIPMRREVSPASDFGALVRIARRLIRFQPDIIHTHSAKAGALGRLAALLIPHARVIHTPHTLPFEWAGGFTKFAYRAIEIMLGRITDAAVALTRAQASLMKASRVLTLGKEPALIPNGVSMPQVLSREEVRKRWGLKPEEVAVVQVARLAPQKACGTFIEAASGMHAAGTRFFLVGDGPLRGQLEDQVRKYGMSDERFKFLGYVPHAERFFSGIDILVLTSLYEGLPYTALEAMAAGLPVVAPRIPGMEEIIDEGRTGMLVSVGDAEAAAKAIEALVVDAKLRQTLAANARADVKARFTERDFAEGHLRLYSTLLPRGLKMDATHSD
jgi:glycosyltransferase involved in cell wall biosynthesis